MGNENWIKEYIHMITDGPLPTMSEDSDDVIMQEKIDGVWQDVSDVSDSGGKKWVFQTK